MMRRWLIRGLALTLLTLCALAWVGSYFQRAYIQYAGQNCYYLDVESGTIRFSLSDDGFGAGRWDWNYLSPWKYLSPYRQQFQGAYQRAKYHFAGFAFSRYHITPLFLSGWFMDVPLYFPTLLSTLLLWLVWRKTRPKYNGRGFPVEAAGKGATKS